MIYPIGSDAPAEKFEAIFTSVSKNMHKTIESNTIAETDDSNKEACNNRKSKKDTFLSAK